MAKFRRSKVKRQHHVVAALEEGLKMIASVADVDGIIPGIIRPKNGGAVGFRFQYLTQSGFKLIGRSSGAVQEIFVITQKPQVVLDHLSHHGIIQAPPVPEPPPDQN